MDTSVSCWVLSDGKAGTENQCIGLAEALGAAFVVKRVRPKPPWIWLPVGHWPAALRALGGNAAVLDPPWPRLVIAGGRRTVPYALLLRRLSERAIAVVQVQDPRVPPDRFDLVVVPRHDGLRDANVIVTRGALTRVTPALLAAARARFAPACAHLPRPLVAVLVGGSSRHHRLTLAGARGLGSALAALAHATGGGLLITASRRTGPVNEAALRAAVQGVPAAFWDGRGDNPYLGYLALADALIVTSDSVSMASEAATTGKPLYVWPLAGASAKLETFHRLLAADGIARRFAGRLEHWTYRPFDDTAVVAEAVRRRLLGDASPVSLEAQPRAV
ncbi:MAG: hypothetical protein FJX56_04715 [Alphaproteobacteria bacterium]|nr:hypothetical protein [Alphaproteobacteria bacterium]